MPKLSIRPLILLFALFVSFVSVRSVSADATAYYVYDSASQDVGLVTVTASGNSSQQYLSATGTYTYTVPSAVTSVTINYVTVAEGQQAVITLPSGAQIAVQCGLNGTEITNEGTI